MNPAPSIAAEDLTFMRCVKKAAVLEVNLYKDIIGSVLKITKSVYSKNPAFSVQDVFSVVMLHE